MQAIAEAYDAVCIAGATASGKSALAMAVAEGVDGTIINADSMQVYHGMPIITASPSASLGAEDYAAIPHRLFGYVAPETRYSQAQWLGDARNAMAECRAENRLPLLVGGTGLYFKAAFEGIAPIPDIPPNVRAEAQAILESAGVEGLHQRLLEVDADLARRLAPSDRQRVLRGMEVWLATGTPLSQWQKQPKQGALGGRILKIYLRPPRATLYARIEARFDAMLEQGAEDEVKALLAQGLDADLPAMKALGVKALTASINGTCTRDEAIAEAKRDSRRYAKRQFTWFDHQYGADLTISDCLTPASVKTATKMILTQLKKTI